MEKYHNCSILLLCLSLSPLLLSLLSQYAFQLRFRTSFFTEFSPSTFSFYPPSHYFLTHYNPTISLGSSSNGWNGYSLRIVNSPNRRIIIQFIEERLFYSIASFIYFHSWFSTLLSQWTFPFDFLTPCFHSIFSPLPHSLSPLVYSIHSPLSPFSHTSLPTFSLYFSLPLLLHFLAPFTAPLSRSRGRKTNIFQHHSLFKWYSGPSLDNNLRFFHSPNLMIMK